ACAAWQIEHRLVLLAGPDPAEQSLLLPRSLRIAFGVVAAAIALLVARCGAERLRRRQQLAPQLALGASTAQQSHGKGHGVLARHRQMAHRTSKAAQHAGQDLLRWS